MSVYLPYCDKFVTDDEGQQKSLWESSLYANRTTLIYEFPMKPTKRPVGDSESSEDFSMNYGVGISERMEYGVEYFGHLVGQEEKKK